MIFLILPYNEIEGTIIPTNDTAGVFAALVAGLTADVPGSGAEAEAATHRRH